MMVQISRIVRGVLSALMVIAVAGCSSGGSVSTGAPPAEGEWARASTGGSVTSVAALGDGFVAVQGEGEDTEILYSPLGEDWSVVEAGTVGVGEQLVWMTGGDGGAAGVVWGDEVPEVIATLDGSTYVRSDPLADLGLDHVSVRGMAWGPAGLAVAYQQDEIMGLFVSDDGQSWSEAALPALAEISNMSSNAMAADGTRYLVVAASAEGDSGFQAWTTPDLVTWTEEPMSPDFIAGIRSVVALGDGFVVSGDTASGGTTETWVSTDAGAWTTLDATGLDVPNGLIAVAGSELGLVALAPNEEYSAYAGMLTTDLAEWQELADGPGFDYLVAANATSIVVPDGGDMWTFTP